MLPVLLVLYGGLRAAAPLPGIALLVAWMAWLLFDIRVLSLRLQSQWTHWLDAAIPELEDSTALLAQAPVSAIAQLQRKRLEARIHQALQADDYRAIAAARTGFRWLPAALSVLVCGACWAWLQQGGAVKPAAPSRAALPPAQPGELLLKVTPPAYTRAAAFETPARDIQVPQYSDVRWCFRRANEPASAVELGDGKVLPVGEHCAQWQADESLFWRARHQPKNRYNIRVTPDQAPEVAIAAPAETVHVLAQGTQAVQIAVSAKDDYGIVRASLHLTLARGSGENIRFSDKEMPLPASADPRVRTWKKQWPLAELGMEPGDELYYFIRATDNAPDHPHTSQSPTYTLRLPGPQSESLDATALPSMVKPENLRSQRQIIIDTEQLVADMPKLSPQALRSRSETIATDQAKLRLRYGQFLGEESSLFGGDEHDEHEGHGGAGAAPGGFGKMDNVLAQFGHAHDESEAATIFDPATKEVLRRALKAMWAAEKELRAIAPKPALPPEYKALEAIKELQQAERVYLHRTAFVPPAIKEEKRMTGDMVGAQSSRRAQGEALGGAPKEVRELVQALGSDGPLPALWSKTARDVIAARIASDDDRLAAQRAVQDVQDGCVECRGALRAWLRGTLADLPAVLQARPLADSRFRQAWRGKGAP
ncbi:DUF4175 domain-containing protein [Pseudoduganella ginsengisoli]